MQKSVITKRLQRAPKLTWKRRTVNAGLMALYCATIFLVLDLIYSRIIYKKIAPAGLQMNIITTDLHPISQDITPGQANVQSSIRIVLASRMRQSAMSPPESMLDG